jgi:hypothetical protein
MARWTTATLVSGQPIYLDLDKASAAKRVLGQGKEFTSIFFGSEHFEVQERPEDLLGIEPKVGAI